MRIDNKKKTIKKLQREHTLFKDIITIMDSIFKNNEFLSKVYCTRVELTDDRSSAIIFLYIHQNNIDQNTATEIIKKVNSYKKQIVHKLSQLLSHNRYVPKISFVFDSQQTKVNKINNLLDSLKDEF